MGSFSTRPGFVLGLAFAVLLLIPLWAAVGLFSAEGHGEGGHGGMKADLIADFRRDVAEFVERYRRPDGCVEPPAPPEREGEGRRGHEEADEPVVYLEAYQWGYRPARLCLLAGVTYRFRMMATDVIHGASLYLGPASRMVRLTPGVPVEMEVTFPQPGEFLLYCSYYCGVGHPYMKGVIQVEGRPKEDHPSTH